MAVNTSSQLVKNGLKETENRIREFVNERVLNMQIINKELESKVERVMMDLNKGINSINDKTNELNNQLKEKIEQFNADAKILYKNIEECKFDNKEVRTTINNLEILMEKKTDSEFMIENNRKEIVNIVKNLIGNEKSLYNEGNQYINKNINNESIDVDNRIQNKNSIKMIKEKKPSSSYIKRNKNYLIESRNKNETSFIQEKEKEQYKDKSNNYLPKFDVLIEKKNFLNSNYNANKKGVNSNKKIYSNHNNQNSMVHSSNINNTYDKEKMSNFNTYVEENNNNPIMYHYNGINNLQIYEDDNKSINNLFNNPIKSLGKKKQELKNPLKTILKLKLDLKDIDAKIRNDIGEKTNSNYYGNGANKINEKTIENYFPISSRIDFRKKKFKEKYGFNSKNEIRNKINYESIGVKDNVKLKAKTLKSIYFKDDKDKKDNKNNLIDNNSNQISRNENKFSLTEFSNTFNKTNKIKNKLQTSKSFKNKYPNQM